MINYQWVISSDKHNSKCISSPLPLPLSPPLPCPPSSSMWVSKMGVCSASILLTGFSRPSVTALGVRESWWGSENMKSEWLTFLLSVSEDLSTLLAGGIYYTEVVFILCTTLFCCSILITCTDKGSLSFWPPHQEKVFCSHISSCGWSKG